MMPPRKSPIDSIAALLRRAPRGFSPPVGVTPHTVVWTENKWKLMRFAPAQPTYATPILLVPSLINRWYVLDLGPGRSLIEWLVAQGHIVYCIDWGTPGPEDRYLTWDDIGGRYLGRAVRIAAREPGSGGQTHVLGYCLGGTLATAYVAAFPEGVASLTALAAPIDFDAAGIMTAWTRTDTFDLAALVAAFGNVPHQLMQASFKMLRPTQGAAKLVALLDRAWDDEFLDGMLVTEKWGTDNVSFPGACYQRYIDELYRQNRLVRGEFTVLGRPARLPSITCPVLAIAFTSDHIVPVASAQPLIDHVASRDKQILVDRGGHVGAVVSRKASERLWPALSTFWAARD
ncbi:MAG: alpha/beta fold hydrolase [Deltaproteobacteria bacterium]|nr:alpha/beta fold hydrolase [Deltaproteobacteria bacterium]